MRLKAICKQLTNLNITKNKTLIKYAEYGKQKKCLMDILCSLENPNMFICYQDFPELSANQNTQTFTLGHNFCQLSGVFPHTCRCCKLLNGPSVDFSAHKPIDSESILH